MGRAPLHPVRALVAATALVALACGNETLAPADQLGADAESYWPGATWRAATPAQLGVKPIVELLSRYAPIANLDDRKRALTVRDVLTMRTGLDWNEDSYSGSPLEQLNTLRTDWLRFVIDWPMREQPGTRWQYNSGGVIALGGAIGIAGGMNTADYARTYLLRPIGITDDKWVRGFPDLRCRTRVGACT